MGKVYKKLTIDEVKNHHGLSVGDLRKFLKDNPDLTDDAPVLVERIEDFYFEKNGWGVVLKEGEHYHYIKQSNQNMLDEIARRERGEDPEYGMENPSDYIQEPTEEDMNQYIHTWCCVKYKDENALFIDLHY
jgi:hypothetical protein